MSKCYIQEQQNMSTDVIFTTVSDSLKQLYNGDINQSLLKTLIEEQGVYAGCEDVVESLYITELNERKRQIQSNIEEANLMFNAKQVNFQIERDEYQLKFQELDERSQKTIKLMYSVGEEFGLTALRLAAKSNNERQRVNTLEHIINGFTIYNEVSQERVEALKRSEQYKELIDEYVQEKDISLANMHAVAMLGLVFGNETQTKKETIREVIETSIINSQSDENNCFKEGITQGVRLKLGKRSAQHFIGLQQLIPKAYAGIGAAVAVGTPNTEIIDDLARDYITEIIAQNSN